MRNIVFTSLAIKEYNEWFETNIRVVDRIKMLIGEIDKNPFKGIGGLNHLGGTGKDIGVAVLILNTD